MYRPCSARKLIAMSMLRSTSFAEYPWYVVISRHVEYDILEYDIRRFSAVKICLILFHDRDSSIFATYSFFGWYCTSPIIYDRKRLFWNRNIDDRHSAKWKAITIRDSKMESTRANVEFVHDRTSNRLHFGISNVCNRFDTTRAALANQIAAIKDYDYFRRLGIPV